MKVIVFPPQDGVQIGQCHWYGAGPLDQTALDAILEGVQKQGYAVYLDETDQLEQAQATIQDGEVVGTPSPYSQPATPSLYIHTTLTGGMQSPAGTLYLKNDGVDALTVHAELRDGPELATSAAVTQLEGTDIDGTWALELVNVDTGALADTPLVQMTAGVIDVSYTTTIAPCELELAEDRLQPIGDYVLKLAQPVRFKIARELS